MDSLVSKEVDRYESHPVPTMTRWSSSALPYSPSCATKSRESHSRLEERTGEIRRDAHTSTGMVATTAVLGIRPSRHSSLCSRRQETAAVLPGVPANSM